MSLPSITLASLAALQDSARALAPLLVAGDVVLLRGEVGVGKTTWVQALATALGVSQAVTSPTFALVQAYPQATLPLWHADLYRIEHAAELAHLGLDELAGERGVVCVEWPEKWVAQWPRATWISHIDLAWICDDHGMRVVEVAGQGPRGRDLARAWLHGIQANAPAVGVNQ